jgi:hypothetical protein
MTNKPSPVALLFFGAIGWEEPAKDDTMNGSRGMKRNRLKYAGRGQIVRESDGRIVSPRDVVTLFNDVCDIADELHKTLTSVLDALAFAQQLKSPAEGVQSQELRNGEAEAVANAVGRESVAQGRTRSNIVKQSSARPAPTAPTGTELRRESGTQNAKCDWHGERAE